MVSTAIVQLLRTKAGQGSVESLSHLGCPVYLLTILGVWKRIGVVTIMMPGLPLLKKWAYDGFFFAISGAIFSHFAVGDAILEILPAILLLVLTMVSWYFRPVSRKLTS